MAGALQVRIQLQGQQLAAMGAARANLLRRMVSIRAERQKTFTAVSMALLQQASVCPRPRPHVQIAGWWIVCSRVYGEVLKPMNVQGRSRCVSHWHHAFIGRNVLEIKQCSWLFCPFCSLAVSPLLDKP